MRRGRCGPGRGAPTAVWFALLLAPACTDLPTTPPASFRLVVTPETAVLAPGDIVGVDVVAVDGTGRPVPVGPVSLTTDDPTVAVIDGTGRLRAVAAGATTLRGAAGGVAGRTEVTVRDALALFDLELRDRAPLPILVAADTVEWNGEKEYHEVFAASGMLALTGGTRPRYEVFIRFEEYDIRLVGGERLATSRLTWNEYDRGTVDYDAAGDLSLTSELVAPLHHRAVPVAGGFRVDFRIPGSDTQLELFYRRQQASLAQRHDAPAAARLGPGR